MMALLALGGCEVVSKHSEALHLLKTKKVQHKVRRAQLLRQGHRFAMVFADDCRWRSSLAFTR